MRASTQTPATMAILLPRQLRQRYSGSDFAWRMANFVLARLEKNLESPYYITNFGLPLETDVTQYDYPAGCRQIRGLYTVDPVYLVPDKTVPIHFEDKGDTLVVNDVITLSDETVITGTITAPGSGEFDVLLDATPGNLDTAIDDDDLVGRLAMVTHANGVVESRIVRANDTAATTASLTGPLRALAATADTYLITDNFLLVEGLRYLTRLTSDDEVLDIPEDWEECFLLHLRLQYEMQADETSPNVQTFRQEAQNALRLLKADARHRLDNPRKAPRDLPPSFT